METNALNWIDLMVLIALTWFAYGGWRRGFVALIIDLAGFVASLVFALLFYPPIAGLIARYAGLARPFAKPLAFFAVWLCVAYAFAKATQNLHYRVPERFRASNLNFWLGTVPGAAYGVLLLSVTLSLAVAVPSFSAVNEDVLSSRSGDAIISVTVVLDRAISPIFGNVVKESLSFLTVGQEEEHAIDLHFTTTEFAPSEADESRMFELLNSERTAVGRKPLEWDSRLVPIARAHDADMLERGYFSHVTPDGLTAAGRADAAEYAYRVYGENLALASDVLQAHRGLMASPGHRANILSPAFSKVGIGILDAGPYGLMVTQNFAD